MKPGEKEMNTLTVSLDKEVSRSCRERVFFVEYEGGIEPHVQVPLRESPSAKEDRQEIKQIWKRNPGINLKQRKSYI